MAEKVRNRRRSDRYDYRYFEDVVPRSKNEERFVTTIQRRPSPPPNHLNVESVHRTFRATTQERRGPSPPIIRPIYRSASTGHTPRSERTKTRSGEHRAPRIEVSQYSSPDPGASWRHHGRDIEDSSPTLMNQQMIPSINMISPDERASGIRSNRAGLSWSRKPGSVVQPDQAAEASTAPSAAGYLGENVYRYSELRPLEMRLLRVLPAKMAAIKCTIAHFPIAEAPTYVALSYAWGDADDKSPIQIDGVKFFIATSLFGAISAIREKGNDVLVWADALCIDQGNPVEKSDQIKLMTSIYAKAVSVAIWLGPEADSSESAMELLKDLRVRSMSEQQIKSMISSPERQRDLAAVATLFSRSYWTRVWVVQEVLNASRINVYCGSTKLPWHVLKTASDIFWHYKEDIDYQFSKTSACHRRYPTLPNSQTHAQALIYEGPNGLLDRRILQTGKEEALLHVLRACRRKHAGEARDKVFALLGVLPESIRKDIPVDYKSSVKEIFTNVVDYLLYTTDSLDVICESVHFPQHFSSYNLPSWVPDWSHNPETTSLSQSYSFSAAGKTIAQWKFIDTHLRNELEISAIYLDTIKYHGFPVGTLCTLADYLMSFLHWRALLIHTFGRSDEGVSSKAAHEAFCRTLNLSQTPREWRQHTNEWMQACYHVFASLLKERLPYLAIDSELEACAAPHTRIQRKNRRQFLQTHFAKYMMGRSFCITERKHIGMGSGFMLPEDIIVVPLGCRTPIILRQEGISPWRYRFIGDVYVDKYMDGRALEMYQSHEAEIEKFVLI